MGKPAEAVMMYQPDLVYFGARGSRSFSLATAAHNITVSTDECAICMQRLWRVLGKRDFVSVSVADGQLTRRVTEAKIADFLALVRGFNPFHAFFVSHFVGSYAHTTVPPPSARSTHAHPRGSAIM